MGRLLTFLLLSSVFILSAFTYSSYNEYSCVSHNEDFRKANEVTCSTCHTLNGGDIIIEGGKDEEEVEEEASTGEIVFVVDFDNVKDVGIQYNVSGVTVSNANDSKPIIKDAYGSLSSLAPVYSINTRGKKEQTITITYDLPEKMDEPQEIVVQGVVANLDGTAEGDFSFYKTITIEPQAIDFDIYPTMAQNELTIDGLATHNQLRVINLLGKTVLRQSVESSHQQLDISTLEEGTYFLVAGIGKNLKSQSFIISR